MSQDNNGDHPDPETKKSLIAEAIQRKRTAADRARRSARLISMFTFTFGIYATGGAVYFLAFREKFDPVLTGPISSSLDSFSRLIVSSIFGFGAVGIAVWLIQLSITFIRYYIRLANVFDAQADAILLSEGEPEALKTYTEALSPEVVDFGQMPKSTQEKLLDTLTELIRKR